MKRRQLFGRAMGSVCGYDAPDPPIHRVLEQTVDMGGLKIKPQYSFENAPRANVIVIPGQDESPGAISRLKAAAPGADVTRSVCVGAFILAKTGLLNGLPATTHHAAYDDLAKQFPKVRVIRGPRYVETRDISTCTARHRTLLWSESRCIVCGKHGARSHEAPVDLRGSQLRRETPCK